MSAHRSTPVNRKARPPGTRRLKPGHKSGDFGTTEANAAFDPACAERAAAAIDGFFKEFSGNQAPETRQWTERYSDLRHPGIGAGDRFRTRFPNPGKAAIMGLPVVSNSLVSRHKIDYFQISGHCHGFVESVPRGCSRGAGGRKRAVYGCSNRTGSSRRRHRLISSVEPLVVDAHCLELGVHR